ncbi:TonB-dependent receptor [Seongchinamella unica]|uniref:TonB-dependent receptor n=1 Tax=Seongchinamella unica TaxID=2547392 RepID=A0A4R5LUH9_9GAMM|nr:TonB-dependent receptor [Seongchinamella unica]TDG14848.1 TonB-dependent receptor [Seongchinamella unica]
MKKRNLVKTALACSLATAWSASPLQAVAQEERIALEEVIVTARKREESMQDIPVTVTALAAELNRSTVKSLQDVQNYVPNVNIDMVAGNNGASISIRGISFQETDKSVEPPAGVILDGVYQGVVAGGLLHNFDMERIEVLRGPQGTLFGKNTTAGALNIVRSAPTREWGVKAQLGAGSWDLRELRAVVNTPLTDNGGLKFYASKSEHDGYMESRISNEDFGIQDYLQVGARVAFNLTDNFDISFNAERIEDDSDVGAWSNFNDFADLGCLISVGGIPVAGIPPDASGAPFGSGCEALDSDSDEDHTPQNAPNSSEVTNDSYNLTMNWALGDWMLTAITGYIEREEEFRVEYDATQVEFLTVQAAQEYEQFSQEVRINGNLTDNINLTAGVYYWNSEYDQFQESFDMWYYLGIGFGPEGGLWPGAISSELDGTGENTSYAVFASVDWQLTDRLQLNLGGRFTEEERKLTAHTTSFLLHLPDDSIVTLVPMGPPQNYKDDWSEFSPRIALTYDVSDDMMLFGSFASGFKSGGFFARTQNVNDINSFDPEYVDTYELGMKSEWLQNRLRFNATAFYSDYTDKQEEVITDLGDGNVTTIVNNAADVEIWGLEAEFNAQFTAGLSGFFNAGYLNAEFSDFMVSDQEGNPVDNSGLELRNAPEYTFAAGLNYYLTLGEVEVGMHYNYRWRDEYHTILNNDPRGLVDAGGFHNASVDLRFGEHYLLSVYGRNMGDERYARVIPIGISTFGQYSPPENYGVELTVNF